MFVTSGHANNRDGDGHIVDVVDDDDSGDDGEVDGTWGCRYLKTSAAACQTKGGATWYTKRSQYNCCKAMTSNIPKNEAEERRISITCGSCNTGISRSKQCAEGRGRLV